MAGQILHLEIFVYIASLTQVGCLLLCDSGKFKEITELEVLIHPKDANVECWYNLQPRYDTYYLRIETTKFQLQDSVGCEDEYVEIFKVEVSENEVGERLTSIGRWCGKSHARFVDINGKVRVKLKVASKPRFYMSVSSVPESFYRTVMTNRVSLVGDPIYIYSPGHPGRYPRNVTVRWELETAPGQLVNVEAMEFQLEDGDEQGNCRYDSLTFTLPSQESVRWCGQGGTRFIRSERRLDMVLKTDNLQHERGFALRVYTTPTLNTSCEAGGVRTLAAITQSQLLSVLPPLNDRVVCSWLIEGPLTDVIQLEVVSWDDENTALECGNRPFQIHDGRDEEGTQLVSKCGTKPFGFIRTSGNAAFITSGLVISRPSSSGFTIKYSTVHKYYYHHHHYNADKVKSFIWVHALPVSFERPVFNIRSDDQFHRCVRVEVQNKWLHVIDSSYTDYVDVYDGTDEWARLMGVCSGEDASSISGSMDTMQIRVRLPVQEGVYLVIDTTGNCDGDVEVLPVMDIAQRLVFPTARMRQQNRFPRDTECTWRLERPAGLIHVDLLEVTLSEASGERCRGAASYLEAYTGDNNKLDTWCNNHMTNVTSINDVMLKVRVNDFLEERNFTVRYWMEPRYECSNVKLFAREEWSYLTSPGFPSNYPNNANCSWEMLSVDPNQNVKLEMIESSTASCSDYTKVYDSAPSRRLLLEACQEGFTTSTLQSLGDNMFVEFNSDAANTDKGFRLAYFTVRPETTGRVNLLASQNTQQLQAPGYPGQYERGIERTWLIQAHTRSAVIILQLVNEADLLPCRSSLDTLNVHDGTNVHFKLQGDFCNIEESRDLSRQLQSEGDSAFVHLRSATAGVAQQHSATFLINYYSWIPDRACRDTEELLAVTEPTYLEFPSHSGTYPGNAECRWRIYVSNWTSTITMSVTRNDIEESYTCDYDSVTVYDGHSTSSRELGVFCGDPSLETNNAIPVYQSSGMYMLIVFKSDSVKHGKGFSISYKIARQRPPPSTEAQQEEASVGLLVGGILGGLSFLVIAITALLCILRRAKQSPPRSESREPVVYNRNNSTVFVVSPVIIGGGGDTPNTAPPPYPGISNMAFSPGPSDDLPPAYHESMASPPPQTISSPGQLATSSIPSPPPYSPSPARDAEERPPDYEAAVGSMSSNAQRADNSHRLNARRTGAGNSGNTDAARTGGGNSTPQRSILYESLGPV